MLFGLLLLAIGIALLASAAAFRRDATDAHDFFARQGHPLFTRFPRLRAGLPGVTIAFGLALGIVAIVAGILGVLGVLDLS